MLEVTQHQIWLDSVKQFRRTVGHASTFDPSKGPFGVGKKNALPHPICYDVCESMSEFAKF